MSKDKYDPKRHKKVWGGWIDDKPKKGCLGIFMILVLVPLLIIGKTVGFI